MKGVPGEIISISDNLVRILEEHQSEIRNETLKLIGPQASLVRLDHAELILHHLTMRLAAAEHCIASRRAQKQYRKIMRATLGIGKQGERK